MEIINSEKIIWTEDDFDQMGWHDNKIYAIAFGIEESEISFDIDYIIRWVDPKENKSNFEFLIAPATLVFRNVYDFSMNFSLLDLIIDGISRDNPSQPKNAVHIKEQIEYDWIIQANNGEITFRSVGYKQYARQKPKLYSNQLIGFAERGAIGFDRVIKL
ncbi:MAG TPA: hypothetical protein VNV85_15080 [Puia sp.]|jgi:hypothetical protein|nr:hypothetical protein [Puia sp.]